jgi:pimeloyl-ACP methyl ester carboxylesterase
MVPPIHPAAPALRRAYADGPAGQIHYYDSGGDGFPLMLLHQSPASSSDWFNVMPHFVASGVRVLAMDTPGMGLSDAPPGEPTISDYADAVITVLDHAGVDRADLLGHHTGAQIAADAAARHPARVRSASLYGAPVLTAEEAQAFSDQILPREREGAIHKPQPGGANLVEYFARVETIFGVTATQRMLLSGLIAGPLWWQGHNAAFAYDMRPALKAVTQPLLLIAHPGDMLEEHTLRAAALRPDAQYCSLPINASMAMDDHPAVLAEAVLGFLAKIKDTSRD